MNSFNILINELRESNPNIEIRVGCSLYDDKASERVFCDINNIMELSIPYGYEFDYSTNSIIGKRGEKIQIKPFKEMKIGTTLPPLRKDVRLRFNSISEFAIMLQKLNPGRIIAFDASRTDVIKVLCPIKDLVLPKHYELTVCNEVREISYDPTFDFLVLCQLEELDLDKDTIVGLNYNVEKEVAIQAELDRMRGIGYEEKVEEKKSRPAIFEVIDERYEDMSNHIKAGIHNIADQHRSNPDRIKGRHFTIVAKEKELDQTASRRGRNAVMAGACIMAAAGAALLHDANIMVSVEQMLSSWEGFAQTFIDMGPISNVLTASASLFMARYFRRTREYHKIENQIQKLNDAYDESLIKGEDNDARSR